MSTYEDALVSRASSTDGVR